MLSASALRMQPAAAGAERRQYREFTLTCLGTREQQIRHVGAGDEQHESDGSLQHPDRSADATKDLVREWCHLQHVGVVCPGGLKDVAGVAASWCDAGPRAPRHRQGVQLCLRRGGVAASLRRPMRKRLWLSRAWRSSSVNPSGSQISV